MRQCRICRSQTLNEVDKLLQDGLSYRDIGIQIKDNFPEINLHALEQSVGRHHKGKHTHSNGHANLAVLKQVYDLAATGQVTWDQFKERVRQIGYQNILANPEAVGAREVIALESVETQKKKEGLQDSTRDRAMAHMFGGFFHPHICADCKKVTYPKPEDYTDVEEVQKYMAGLEQMGADHKIESFDEWSRMLYFYLLGTDRKRSILRENQE